MDVLQITQHVHVPKNNYVKNESGFRSPIQVGRNPPTAYSPRMQRRLKMTSRIQSSCKLASGTSTTDQGDYSHGCARRSAAKWLRAHSFQSGSDTCTKTMFARIQPASDSHKAGSSVCQLFEQMMIAVSFRYTG